MYFLICKIDSKKPVKLREIILDSPTKKHKVIERKIKNEFPELNKNTSRSTKHLKSILNLISFPSPITQGKFEKEIDRLFIKIKKVPDFTGRNPDGILAACLYYVHKKNKNLKRLNQKEICEYCHVPKSIVAQNLKDFKEMKLLD